MENSQGMEKGKVGINYNIKLLPLYFYIVFPWGWWIIISLYLLFITRT